MLKVCPKKKRAFLIVARGVYIYVYLYVKESMYWIRVRGKEWGVLPRDHPGDHYLPPPPQIPCGTSVSI